MTFDFVKIYQLSWFNLGAAYGDLIRINVGIASKIRCRKISFAVGFAPERKQATPWRNSAFFGAGATVISAWAQTGCACARARVLNTCSVFLLRFEQGFRVILSRQKPGLID
jgi:hypothetical protein